MTNAEASDMVFRLALLHELVVNTLDRGNDLSVHAARLALDDMDGHISELMMHFGIQGGTDETF